MQRQFSAGGFVYKIQITNNPTSREVMLGAGKSQILWLIRRPKMNPGFKGNPGWSWPKGWIDQGEDARTAALREVREEAGVEAEIRDKIDTIKIFFKDKGELVMKNITYFLMGWTRDLPQGFGEETEETRWVNSEEAKELLVYDNEKELLEKAIRMIK